MNENRLRRSTDNKILGGLCGGLGEYFKIDPTIIRLIWIIAAFWIGLPAIIAYFIGLIVISVAGPKEQPIKEEPATAPVMDEPVNSEPKHETGKERNTPSKSHLIWGWLIIGLGVVILFESLGYFNRFKEFVFPAALIVAGIWVLIKGFEKRK